MQSLSPVQQSSLHRSLFDPGHPIAEEPDRIVSQRVRPGVLRLLDAFRQHGYRSSVLDPLESAPVAEAALLTPERFGLVHGDAVSEDDSPLLGAKTVQELTSALHAVYCGSLALDASAVRDETRLAWLYAEMETPVRALPLPAAMTGTGLLARLVGVQSWEHYVARRFPNAKRFSLEGCEALIPLLDVLVAQAGAYGVRELLLGMPHRGRINVLVNLLGRSAPELLSYFDPKNPDPERHKDLPYHLGARHRVSTRHGDIDLQLAANPSHLQSVMPVVAGMARASQDHGEHHAPHQTLPVVMHGDAALAGQGVVMETLMLGRKAGYTVGGTVHIVINNQVGFTELHAMDARQPRYASDVARMIDAPVLRVSADAPEQVQRAAAIALAYRARFGGDVFIDLIGYRRLGHSEHDVPTLTAPTRQSRIDQLPTVVDRFAAQLCSAGRGSEPDLALFITHCRERAQRSFERPLAQAPALGQHRAAVADLPAPGLAQLQGIVSTLTRLPDGFQPHAMVQALIQDWQSMSANRDALCDWRFAENMAYATLLQAGIGVRVSGMDVRRGTFMHRQAVWHGQQADGQGPAEFQPLDRLRAGPVRFEVYNSLLSEEAVLGFEYGYSLREEHRLAIWEAQFGDFVNGAQVFIDHYIASGEAKWGFASGLMLLLPHGYEGVGPEHSSGFLGRFLQLCAQGNLQVAMPSTAAQWFHLLRRQASLQPRRPLVVMSPKGTLYEEPGSHTPLQRMLEGAFEPVLDDATVKSPASVERVVLSSGKLHYDLERARQASSTESTALLRLEQLYPFPQLALQRLLQRYSGLRELVWAQEEELNQGAWPFIRDELTALCPQGVQLRCVARPSTATGPTVSQVVHRAEQRLLAMQALGLQ
ncbi:2-oxoglutarate dehydrogenase E1 component [Hylemonella gracilis]|nr:2-oxoglutarate dehydrogenase E1 component [Hylemonella gracilis]